MNVSGFNEATLNSAVPDVTVRAAVLGYAYAMGSLSSRMRTRLIVAQEALALTSLTPRKAIRNTGVLTAQAVRTGADTVAGRSLINSQAVAFTAHETHTVLLRLSVSALALAEATPRVARRGVIDGYVSALATLGSHKAAREPADSVATAQATLTSRTLTRQPEPVNAQAQAAPILKAAARSLVAGQALAMGFVGANTTIFYPFDEPATEENTFIVAFEDNLFYVR